MSTTLRMAVSRGAACGLQTGCARSCCQDVRRCVDQHPRRVVGAADGNRRLCPRHRCGSSRANAGAIAAVAVPLRKAATGRRTEDMRIFNGQRRGPRRARAFRRCNQNQRLAMYIVISMPNRKSIAAGVSQIMAVLLSDIRQQNKRAAWLPPGDPYANLAPARSTRQRKDHECRLMIFMNWRF